MTLGDLPLSRIFWTVFALQSAVVAVGVVFVLHSIVHYTPSDGGLVGAWLILIPVAALALLAGLFIVFQAPWVRAGLIVLMLIPLWGPVLGRAFHLVREPLVARWERAERERQRLGEYIFAESGARQLAAAIADRDLARIQAALPGAGDLNRLVGPSQSNGRPRGDHETLLSFALLSADESDASAAVIELLLSAGANPNLPHALPMSRAMQKGIRLVDLLRRAGGDINAPMGSDGWPLWWSVLEHGPRGSSDVTMLRYLLDHGADIHKRVPYGQGPVELAVEGQRWAAVALLAGRMPGVKDMVIGRNPNLGREGEAVHALLAQDVAALQQARQPIPEGMRAALAAFGEAAR